MKTFYNANALQNHKNIQHDEEVQGSDGDHQPPSATLNVQVRLHRFIKQLKMDFWYELFLSDWFQGVGGVPYMLERS